MLRNELEVIMKYSIPVFSTISLIVAPSFTEAIVHEPQRAVVVLPSDMPKIVESFNTDKYKNFDIAISSYHKLKNIFNISNTEMSKWLGVKRRSLYNWLNNPSSSKKYRKQIEERLANLLTLQNEMEKEHYRFLYKVAFSPIYGDTSFGSALLNGETSQTLCNFYDSLFDKFETLRKNSTISI